MDLFVGTFADYERAKERANQVDFDDLLIETVDLLESDPAASETIRARKRWFSVDEYQDTNPLQQRLLELWLGERDDLCVVGDEDQTIYSFTGATSDYLKTFVVRHPGATEIPLSHNYRSPPRLLAPPNPLLPPDAVFRADARPRASRRSEEVALPQACAERYARIPDWNFSRPIQLSNIASTAPPLP